MNEFFSGGRRTNGCALLVLACVFMVGWLRSFVLRDEILIQSEGDETHLIRSHDQAIRYVYHVWSVNGPVRDEEVLVIPYAAIVPPLSLLSAWLLLRKPRNTTPQKRAPVISDLRE